MIVEGQVHGGVAQGIAQALYEEAVYDAEGNLRHRHRWSTTCVPAAPDLPHFDTDRTETPATTQPAGRQGRRRGRHHRLDPGRRSTRSSTRCARSASTTSTCLHAGAGLAGDPRRRCRARRRRHGRLRRTHATATTAGGAAMIPAAVRLRRGRRRWTRRSPALGEAGDDAKVLAGGQSLHPAAAAAAGLPDRAGRPRPGRRAARRPRRRRRARHRRA